MKSKIITSFLASGLLLDIHGKGVNASVLHEYDPKFDGKGVDASIFQDLPCVSSFPERLINSEKLIALVASTVKYDSPGLDIVSDYVGKLSFNPDNFTIFVEGVGVFVGIDYVAEYNSLADAALNNGLVNMERRELLAVECVDKDASINDNEKADFTFGDEEAYEGSVSLRITFREEVLWNYGADRAFRVNQHVHTYAHDSNLLLSFRIQLAPDMIDAVSENMATPRNLCEVTALRCPGDLFPYDSLGQCYETLSSLPQICKPQGENCYNCVDENSVFQGDTLQCRSLHSLLLKVRPELHCAHMGNISAPCQPEACPEFTERRPLEEVKEELKPFDASLSNWLRVVEFVIAIHLLLLPILSFVFYRKLRVKPCTNCGECPCYCHKGQELTVDVDSQAEINLPLMRCALRLRYVKDGNDDDGVVFSAKNIDLGGCRMTALSGKSGVGKSTLMKLICGIPQPHMKLEMNVMSKVPVAYVPQSTEMWPRLMKVRDILLFCAKLQGVDLNEYAKFVDMLLIRDLFDQTFKSLSGGQQQRVHILANLMHPEPTLIFMDEPVSALDEDNAVAALELLHKLPVKHAFVITMHQMSPRLQEHFDRVLEVDLDQKKLIKKHYSFESQTIDSFHDNHQLSEGGGKQSQSFVGSVRSLFFLWHAMFWGWPVFDVGACILAISNSLISGVMVNGTLETKGSLVDFVPSRIGTRFPVFLVQFLANIAALSAFVVALIYSIEDRKILFHFSNQGKLRPSHVMVFNFLRAAYYGLIFATIFLGGFMALLGDMFEGTADLDTMIMNAAFFSTAYITWCYALAHLVPPLYSSQILLLSFLPMSLFTGVFFPWDTLSEILKVLHYVNPMFWCFTANAHLLLGSFDARCHVGADPYITCAESDALISIGQIRDLSSMDSQLVSAGLLLLAMLIIYVMHQQVVTYTALGHLEEETLKRHQSVKGIVEKIPLKTHQSRRASIDWEGVADIHHDPVGRSVLMDNIAE